MSIFDQIKADREVGTPGPWWQHEARGQAVHCGIYSTSNGGTMPGDSLYVASCTAPTTLADARKLRNPIDELEAAATHQKFAPIMEANARRIARLPQLERIALAAEELAQAVESWMAGHGTYDGSLSDALSAFREACK